MMNKTPSSYYKIRFHDCDMFGHLNNARYLDYMINARQDHLKDIYGFDYDTYYKNNRGWVVSHHEIQYLKPAYFGENVCIQSSLLHADSDSLQVEILMLDEAQTQLKAILRSRLTFINIKSGRKEQHSAEFTDWAKSLLPEQIETDLTSRTAKILADLKQKKQAPEIDRI